MNKELIELLKEAYNAGIIYEDSKGEQMCWTDFLDTIKNKQLNLLNSSSQVKEKVQDSFRQILREEFLVNTQNYPKEYHKMFSDKFKRAEGKYERIKAKL